jgi:hypothetical protein
LAEKFEEKNFFSCRLPPSIFLVAFLAVSLHGDPKNTTKIFSKIRLENLKKSQEELGIGRIWWSEATRLEDPLDISNGTWTPKSSGERDGILNLV